VEELARCDAVYFVSGDLAALRAARRCEVLLATARELATLRRAAVPVDVLVGSGEDAAERFESGELDPEPQIVVTTAGGLGGWIRPGGPFRAAPLPVRSPTPTAAATASRPASRTGWRSASR